MIQHEPLAHRAVIPNTVNPMAFAGGEDEAGTLVLQFYASGEEIEQSLELRWCELIVVLQEECSNGTQRAIT